MSPPHPRPLFTLLLLPLLLPIHAYRRVKKEDMRRIAKATGASIVTTLADMEGNETFDADVLGEAEEVRERSQGVRFPGGVHGYQQ